KEGDNWLVHSAKRIYEPALRWALRHRWVVLVLAVVLFAISILLFKQLGAEFVPQLDEGSTVLMLTGPASVAIDTSLAQQRKAEQALIQEFPEIAHVFSRIGTAEVQTDAMGPNLSDTFIFFVPRAQWREVNGRRISKDDLAELMSKNGEAKKAGLSPAIKQATGERFNEMLGGRRA